MYCDLKTAVNNQLTDLTKERKQNKKAIGVLAKRLKIIDHSF